MAVFTQSLVERQPVVCRLFSRAIDKGSLAHAYLFTGRANDDKWLFSKQLACALNCQSTKLPCTAAHQLDAEDFPKDVQLCRNCRWILQGSHPDAWFVLEGDNTSSGRIPVDKARLLGERLGYTSSLVRTVIIPDATYDIFHRPAANALLKTIEEPNGRVLFLLFAPQAELVLPTIVSRCQVVSFSRPLFSGFWPAANQNPQELEMLAKKYDLYPGADTGGIMEAASSVNKALSWSQKFQAAASQEMDPHCVIDWVVAREVSALRDAAQSDAAVSGYLARLLRLAEKTKEQLDSYVQPKNAFDAFALACRKL